MARFYHLYIRRSDGKLEIVAHSKKEKNQPTDEQLDQRPDKNGVSDFYREVGPDEAKHLDWRRKLGGMLARELSWKDKNADSGYILAAFPENYRLYEHVKRQEKDGKLEVKSKTHAAGGNDRQDAYLYGHPIGRRKRFRSPGDFFPHVLWLSTDESGDPDNCSCKICSPEDLETLMPGLKVKSAEAKPTTQPVARPTSTQSSKSVVKQEIKQEPATARAQTHVPPTQNPRPSVTQAQAQQPRRPAPTPLPPKQSEDQFIDSQYESFIYRPGELVWFQRGPAWGLGVILRRWNSPSGTTSTNNYNIQPLSHPPLTYPPTYPNAVTISSAPQMRPWLAWSVPKYTNDGLNHIPNPPTYETADWQGLQTKRYGNGDLEVDGSILAAKMVDESYTLFPPISNTTGPPQYPGLYLGCEKVWLGDPLRLHQAQGTDILVLHGIIPSSSPTQPPSLRGDIYTLLTTPHTNPQIPTPASLRSNPHLPTRLTSDLAYRNARSITAKGIASYWALVQPSATIPINEVKGRWYEASRILPTLLNNPSDFDELARKGDIGEASLWMNSRGDCVNSNRTPEMPRLERRNVRRESRLQAFGRSLPEGTRIWEGVKPPEEDQQQQQQQQQQGHQGHGSDDVGIDARFETADSRLDHGPMGGGGFEELMDLDGGGGGGSGSAGQFY